MTVVLKVVGATLLLGSLVACKQAPQTPSPIQGIVKQFESDRKVGIEQYGLRTITSMEQNIGGVDCLVFNEAAKSPIPTSLGGLSAIADAMYYRMAVGCAPTQQALTDYETTRRLLNTAWNTQLQNLPYTSQMLLKESPLGKMVADRVSEVVTEQTVCLSLTGVQAQQAKDTKNLRQAYGRCSKSVAGRNTQMQCSNAQVVSATHAGAQGVRDESAWMSELASRWRLAFNVCAADSLNTYVAFHNTVPRDLFQGPAYRFSIPVDPVFQCEMQNVVNKRGRNWPARPDREWVECGRKLYEDFGAVYSADHPPEVFNKAILLGDDDKQWIYNPKNAARNPQQWNFGVCEKELAATMAGKGLNIPSPRALKIYCSDAAAANARKNL